MMPMRPLYAKLVSVVIAASALIFIYGSLKMPMGTVLTPAAGLVPLLLGCGTLVLAIVAIVSPEPAAPEGTISPEAEAQDQPDESRKVPRPLLIMIVLGLIIFAFERAGFIVAMLGGSFIMLRFIESRPLIQSLIISLVFSGGLYFLFSKLLYVNLPGGWLGF
jgi:hypothetical protein